MQTRQVVRWHIVDSSMRRVRVRRRAGAYTLGGMQIRRHPLAAAAALLAALALAACGAEAVHTVSADAFAKEVRTPGVTIIDVRTPGEFAAGHIEGAVNIDYQGDFAAGIASLDKAKTYAVYCASGTRSGAAAQDMAAAGFTDVYNLDGGATYWQAAGYELVI